MFKDHVLLKYTQSSIEIDITVLNIPEYASGPKYAKILNLAKF